MKIVIEIPDAALRNAVESQVSATVSKFTEDVIREKVTQIVDTKMSRIGMVDVTNAIESAAKKIIDAHLGVSDYHRKPKLEAVLSSAAISVIKGTAK